MDRTGLAHCSLQAGTGVHELTASKDKVLHEQGTGQANGDSTVKRCADCIASCAGWRPSRLQPEPKASQTSASDSGVRHFCTLGLLRLPDEDDVRGQRQPRRHSEEGKGVHDEEYS